MPELICLEGRGVGSSGKGWLMGYVLGRISDGANGIHVKRGLTMRSTKHCG